MTADPPARPWRRFLRFSMRGVVVLVLIIGVWLGWLVRSARIQREAVASILNDGGLVVYGWDEWDEVPGERHWAPPWLVDLVGVDYFSRVTFARILGPGPFAEPSFARTQVGRLTGITKLDIFYSTDAEILQLRDLSELSELDLHIAEVSDDGLMHLKGLSKLAVLRLGPGQVTDAGVNDLKLALPGLQIIR